MHRGPCTFHRSLYCFHFQAECRKYYFLHCQHVVSGTVSGTVPSTYESFGLTNIFVQRKIKTYFKSAEENEHLEPGKVPGSRCFPDINTVLEL